MAFLNAVPGAGALEIADAPVGVPGVAQTVILVIALGEVTGLIPVAGIVVIVSIVPVVAVVVIDGAVAGAEVAVMAVDTALNRGRNAQDQGPDQDEEQDALAVAPAGLAPGAAAGTGGGFPVGVDPPVVALLQQLLEKLVHRVGLVPAPVTDGPAAVGLVFVDHHVLAVPVDAEGPGLPVVLPDEKAHAQQGHAPLGAVFLEFFNGLGQEHRLWRLRNIVFVGGAAIGADLLVRAESGPAIGTFAGRWHLQMPPFS